MTLRYFARIAPKIGSEVIVIVSGWPSFYEVIEWKDHPNEHENLEVKLKLKEKQNALDTNAERKKENEKNSPNETRSTENQ